MIPILVFSQKNDSTTNRTCEKIKDGYCTEFDGIFKREIYYHNGKKNGIYKVYSHTGSLRYFGEYKDDMKIGIWYYFENDGRLMMILTNFEEGQFDIPKTSVLLGDYLPHKGYCVDYYPNGMKQDEGILLWDNSPESDFACEYGEWKYYDENGNLTETKYFY
jgi:antitoxin component YwqK of YwqJK toxin-antitoxin module